MKPVHRVRSATQVPLDIQQRRAAAKLDYDFTEAMRRCGVYLLDEPSLLAMRRRALAVLHGKGTE